MEIKKSVKISLGDLARHTMKYDRDDKSSIEKIGLIVSVNPLLGSGFQSADILWCSSGYRETVMIYYLETVQSI